MAKIKSDHKLESCTSFRAKDLEDMVMRLADDQILMIVGNIPDPDTIQNLDYSLLNEVIQAVHARSTTATAQSGLNAPKFDEKIVFNGLSHHPATLLKNASYQSGALEHYFSQNSTFAKQSLRDELNRMYLDAKAATAPDSDGQIAHGDLIFFELLRQMTPRDEKPIQDAGLVVLAFYFESCDVFEDPSSGKA